MVPPGSLQQETEFALFILTMGMQKSDDPTHPAYIPSLCVSGETERILA